MHTFTSDDTCEPHSWQDILSVPFLWSDKNDSHWYVWHLEYIWLRPPASCWIHYLFSISSFQWCVTSCMFFIHKHVYTANRFRCVTTTCLSDFVFSWSRANSIEQREKDNCAIEGREILVTCLNSGGYLNEIWLFMPNLTLLVLSLKYVQNMSILWLLMTWRCKVPSLSWVWGFLC